MYMQVKIKRVIVLLLCLVLLVPSPKVLADTEGRGIGLIKLLKDHKVRTNMCICAAVFYGVAKVTDWVATFATTTLQTSFNKELTLLEKRHEIYKSYEKDEISELEKDKLINDLAYLTDKDEIKNNYLHQYQ